MDLKVLPVVLALLVGPLTGSQPAQAGGVRILDAEASAGAEQVVDIDLPFGQLLVEGGAPGTTVEASLTIDCEHETDKCHRRAERVSLVIDSKKERLDVGVDGAARASTLGLSLRLRVRVPSPQAVEIDLGAGDVSTRGLLGSVEIDVGVGDVEVVVPQSHLRWVRIHTGVGSALLTTDLGDVRGAGVVRSGLEWSQAGGTARVEVDTGIGDILVETRREP